MGKRKATTRWPGLGSFAAILRVATITFLLVGSIAGGVLFGIAQLRRHVAVHLAYPPQPPKVVLKNRPAWMSDAIARDIVASAQPRGVSSAMDHQFVKDIAEVLAHNAWVRRVNQVRRAYGKYPGEIVEIDCEYRAPIALVASGNEYLLVDEEGYRLPGKFKETQLKQVMASSDGQVILRVVEGVAGFSSLAPGQKWAGEDLRAGLDLVRLLYGRPFAQEIHKVNVGNFHGRRNPREAQLVLVTRYGSELRWGAPMDAANSFELPPAHKLERLASLYHRFGRIDADHSWLDIRFDKITYPAEEAPIVQAGANPSRRFDN